MDAEQLLRSTRSVRRRFDFERAVDRSVLERCVDTAVRTPSRSNSQPWHFVLVDDPERIAALAKIYLQIHEFTLAARTGAGEADAVQRSSFFLAENFGRLRCVVLPLAEGRPPADGGTFLQASMWGSVFPAVWNFMLACRLHDLGTVLTTLPLFFEDEVLAVVGADPSTFTLSCVVPVGHLRDPALREAPRPDQKTFTTWNHLHTEPS